MRYYADSLAAAWMADKFEMRFTCRNGYELDILGKNTFFCISDDKNPAHKAYVHPDSLHLLEPQVGDLFLVKEGGLAFYLDEALCKKWDKRPEGKIILRTGIAFMWPETENRS